MEVLLLKLTSIFWFDELYASTESLVFLIKTLPPTPLYQLKYVLRPLELTRTRLHVRTNIPERLKASYTVKSWVQQWYFLQNF